MKYAIIYKTKQGKLYLRGFTNDPIMRKGDNGETYTVVLRELSTLTVLLEGDAAIYLGSLLS